ncbi:MAG: putative glutamine amidotransferase [Patescibacteria group bacterium]|nr:putative glutamine amidotransferase [Patescibacteria group bacterium]
MLLNPEMPMSYIMELCDGIVIAGGEDIEPSLYGGANNMYPKEPIERSQWEFGLIKECDKQKVPILGICYGMQLLAVYYGGALHQDIATEVPESINHNRTLHNVRFREDFLGFEAGSNVVVNSRHHQAVAVVPDGFLVCAEASDGVIEAIQGRGHFGVQWHSEADETSRHIYRLFVEHCQMHW